MVGDIYTAFSNVVSGAYLEVKPGSGIEVVIHNIYHNNDVTVKLVNGGNELEFYADTGSNVINGLYTHIDDTSYLRVYNAAGTDQYIAIDGIVTKE